MEKVEQQMSKLGLDQYYQTPVVQKIAQKTKQKPSLIVLCFLVLFIGILFTRLGACLSTMICFIIPAYETFKSLETETKEDDERLLTYWVVFGFFYFFDQVLSWVLSLIPFYYLLRTAIMFYIFLPEFNGASKIYNSVLKPFFEKYQQCLDKCITPFEQMGNNVKQVVKQNKKEE